MDTCMSRCSRRQGVGVLAPQSPSSSPRAMRWGPASPDTSKKLPGERSGLCPRSTPGQPGEVRRSQKAQGVSQKSGAKERRRQIQPAALIGNRRGSRPRRREPHLYHDWSLGQAPLCLTSHGKSGCPLLQVLMLSSFLPEVIRQIS